MCRTVVKFIVLHEMLKNTYTHTVDGCDEIISKISEIDGNAEEYRYFDIWTISDSKIRR